MVLLQYFRSMGIISPPRFLVSIPKTLGTLSNIRTGFATTRGQTASLFTTPPRKGRQSSNQVQRIQWLPIKEKKKSDQLKAAGLPLNHIKQYLAKFKQKELDAANWSEEETNRASTLKAEGMNDDRIHKLLKLHREDGLESQISGAQHAESKVKAALEKWVEEDKKLQLEKSKWSSTTSKRARHLKGAGMSLPEIGAQLLIIEAAKATTVPIPRSSHQGQTIVPAIYYDGGGVGGPSAASSASNADGVGAEIGGGGGDGIDIFDFLGS